MTLRSKGGDGVGCGCLGQKLRLNTNGRPFPYTIAKENRNKQIGIVGSLLSSPRDLLYLMLQM